MSPSPVLVLGIGNLLLGDEGVGIHAVRALEQERVPAHVTLVDGGTGGFQLLEYLTEFPTVVLIDATLDGRPPGSMTVTEPRYPSDFPRSLTAHDIGLRDLIESAALLGPLPRLYLVAVSIAEEQPMCGDLSAQVGPALPRVVSVVCDLLARLELGSGPAHRPIGPTPE